MAKKTMKHKAKVTKPVSSETFIYSPFSRYDEQFLYEYFHKVTAND
ncbi:MULTISPECIES: hypothetical protein [Halobacillus]|nr:MULTISPECIES: hypothetical protein [Halobacillus]